MTPPRFSVELDRGAKDDLLSLHAYVTANRSRDQADELLSRLLDRIAKLEQFPLRGSVPKELEALGITDYRQIVVPPYRLIYYIVDIRVIIAVIADGRRDMAQLLTRRLLGR